MRRYASPTLNKYFQKRYRTCRSHCPSFDAKVGVGFTGQAVRESSLKLKLNRRQNNAIHGDSQGQQRLRGGRSAETEAPRRNGQVQRRAGESRRAAGRRGAPRECKGQARPLLRSETHRDRRALHRDQRADRRLLAMAGEVDGRGERMGQTLLQTLFWGITD